MKKRVTIIVSYWAAAVLIIAAALSSLELSFTEALAYSSLFLPGALAMKYSIYLIKRDEPKGRKFKSIIFVSLAVTAFEMAFVMLVSTLIMIQNGMIAHSRSLEVPGIMLNPVFLLIMIGIMMAGDYFLEQYLDKSIPVKEEPLTFFSDRRKETVLPSEIVYVESNDTEVWIHMKDGRKLRNKTAISRWQDILGEGFTRIHRSYLVNRTYVSSASPSQVTLDGISLPVSKKYAEIVTRILGHE